LEAVLISLEKQTFLSLLSAKMIISLRGKVVAIDWDELYAAEVLR
jgi:hypothetical protein